MKIGIAVFSYNRCRHLQQVLDGLKKNIEIEKIYIFHDGLKEDGHKTEWENVRRTIDNITWCEKVCIFSEYNKGLAKSIVDGVTFVLQENDAVIVLEDDCVPTADFIRFMTQCFEKYRSDKRVYTVSGYSWPIELQKAEYDVYGCGRISSWGWGTWKDRWEKYCVDSNLLKRLKSDRNKSYNLGVWGNDLEATMLNSITDRCDSWAVYWALNVIERGGICINPYQSLIQNIGFDNTGVNCSMTDRFQSPIFDGAPEKFLLPDEIEVQQSTKLAFAELYGSYTAAYEHNMDRENILVYGVGNFFARNEKSLNEKYNIEGFIDREKKGWIGGKKIIRIDDVSLYDYDKIIIMIQSMRECINIAKELISREVNAEQIMLGPNLFGQYSSMISNISVLPDGRLALLFGDTTIKIKSEDEFNNVCEIWIKHTYDYFINNKRKDVILDIGMNIGDSVLYFFKHKNVDKVYGFEPFKETYLSAIDNLSKYLKDSDRLEIFNYGISNRTEEREVEFNYAMSCGQSTIKDIRKRAYESYKSWGLIKEDDEQIDRIEVRKASDVFAPIIEKYPEHNIILKMDCEGEEYEILEELIQSGIINKITFIMMEWHYRGKDTILGYLENAGFSWWCDDKGKDMGLIYAFQGTY